MDLVAVVTEDERVDVLRFNGQRAFGLQRKDDSVKVGSICWKYNGNL
jgi:anaphase-promoting complex subunit 4